MRVRNSESRQTQLNISPFGVTPEKPSIRKQLKTLSRGRLFRMRLAQAHVSWVPPSRITVRFSFPLPNVAPNDLTHSNNQHDCAVECPVLVALHEAATEGSPCKIQSLQDPDPSHQNHQDTDKAADYSHHHVEHTPHRIPRMRAYTSRALFVDSRYTIDRKST